VDMRAESIAAQIKPLTPGLQGTLQLEDEKDGGGGGGEARVVRARTFRLEARTW
jgi:hypothetical protein